MDPHGGPRARETSRVRRPRWVEACGYGILMFLVWGATAWWQGFFQDDAALLFAGQVHAAAGPRAWLQPTGGTRYLLVLPFHLAYVTAWPVRVLQALYGIVWLAIALATGGVARELSASRRCAFVATCLTLTATSDYLSNSLVGLGYDLGAWWLLLAIWQALAWCRTGRRARLVLAVLGLVLSLATVEAALPVLPAAVLLVVAARWRQRRRWLALLGGWCVAALPFAILTWKFVRDPKSYAAVALVSFGAWERFRATAGMTLLNFAPWRWVLNRHEWYPRPAAVIAPSLWSLAGVAGAAIFLACAARSGRPARGAPRLLVAALAAGLATLSANAAYAGVQFSDLLYRTHLVSRTFASLALALVVAAASRRWRSRGLLVVPAVFVFCGVAGGVERQDLFLSTWRQHRAELVSIVAALGDPAPGTAVVLRGEAAGRRYLATAADYLADSWIQLLYPGRVLRVLRLQPSHGSSCRPEDGGVRCFRDQQAACAAAGTCVGEHYAYDRLAVLDLAADGTYFLRTSLDGDPLGGGAGAAAYVPRRELNGAAYAPRRELNGAAYAPRRELTGAADVPRRELTGAAYVPSRESTAATHAPRREGGSAVVGQRAAGSVPAPLTAWQRALLIDAW